MSINQTLIDCWESNAFGLSAFASLLGSSDLASFISVYSLQPWWATRQRELLTGKTQRALSKGEKAAKAPLLEWPNGCKRSTIVGGTKTHQRLPVMWVVRESKLQNLAWHTKLEAVNLVSSILLSWAVKMTIVVIATLAIQRSEGDGAFGRSVVSGSKDGSVGISTAARSHRSCN